MSAGVAKTHPPLPRREMLEQPEVQAGLSRLRAQAGRLSAALAELLAWSESVGCFEHLTAENEYLFFRDAEYDVELNLQVNYSRLGYKPSDTKRTIECPLCFENIGSPGKEKLRAFEFTLGERKYFAHPTPFPLHHGHFVVNCREHTPMSISPQTLSEAAAFVAECPGWLLASNSDVPWAGASVMGHHHFQVFQDVTLPVENAEARVARRVGPLRLESLHWPVPTARISGPEDTVLEAAVRLIEEWRTRYPEKATFNYLARHSGQGHLTLTMIFRHPDFRRPVRLLPVKSEGVGVIEMSGEVIVPPLHGLSREENLLYFQSEGLSTVRGVIEGNAPRSQELNEEFFATLILNAFCGKYP